MRSHAAERDPARNPYFSRRWVDDPLGLSDFQHLGREVAPRVAEGAGRRAIARWIDKVAQTHNEQAAEAFQQANAIRQKLGLDWHDLINERRAA